MASADGGGGGGYSSADVGLAFGLVLGAGFSTTLGALMVLCIRMPPSIHLSSLKKKMHNQGSMRAGGGNSVVVSPISRGMPLDHHHADDGEGGGGSAGEDDGDAEMDSLRVRVMRVRSVLSISLGFAAGVMIYVSFVEIFMVKTVDAFTEYLGGGERAQVVGTQYSTYVFFAGIAFMAIVDAATQKLIRCTTGRTPSLRQTTTTTTEMVVTRCCENDICDMVSAEVASTADDMERGRAPAEQEVEEEEEDTKVEEESKKRLHASGMLTALAIGIHNFPEGLATFVATLADPSAGVTLAIAIAVHNIPEGLCVSMPIYAATGNRVKAIGYALLSGVTEIFGALFGYLVLRGAGMSPLAYGILFGMVAGMMVFVSLKELIPTSLQYATGRDRHQQALSHAQKDRHQGKCPCLASCLAPPSCGARTTTSVAVFAGMAVMASSLLLFGA